MTDKDLLDRAAQAHRANQTASPLDRIWDAVDKQERFIDNVRIDSGEYDEHRDSFKN